jgi:predicted acetyltransferase/SAM-dependent methyltransferase
MTNDIGNYAKHAQYWDWGGHDRTAEYEYWSNYAGQYGKNVLTPMCALGETGAYMAKRGFTVTAFDVTPEMIAEGKKRFGRIRDLQLFEGDVIDFRFDITPSDFCFCTDFGHIHELEDIEKSLVCINNHLRDGGCLVIEAGLPCKESVYTPPKTFHPLKQVYPNLKVWKTGDGRSEVETGRHYISQKFYAEDEKGNVESFDHSFYLQSYPRETWLVALKECGFEVKGEYKNREKEPWCECDGYWIIEAVKKVPGYRKYTPKMNLDHLRTPIYKHSNAALYNDFINLEQPNNGVLQYYRFSINVEGKWVGWIQVKIGYSLRAYYDGQIGYMIDDENNRNKGHATNACVALKPFLRKFGYDYITITSDENNTASRRVCEKIDAKLLEVVDTPTWTSIYKQGQRRTCIYEWKIDIEDKNG